MNNIPKISIKEVAKIMGKGEQCIRIGLQRGLFPFIVTCEAAEATTDQKLTALDAEYQTGI